MKYELLGKLSLKCVIVGDCECGKTSLACRITSKDLNKEYVPTTFDNYAATIVIDDTPYHLSMFDTSGRDDTSSSKLRVLSYVNCDIFLVCFSVLSEQSLEHAEDRWIPEIRMHHPSTPIILVGTQIDRRFETPDIQTITEQTVSQTAARDVVIRTNIDSYVECSAVSGEGVSELIREIIMTGSRAPESKPKPKCKCCQFM